MAKEILYSEEAAVLQDPLSDYEPIVYDSELHRALAEDTVDAVEARPCIRVEPTATVREAVAGHRHVPVLAIDGTSRGIISPRRVFDFIEKHFDE